MYCNCMDVEDLLSPYLDHELLPDENSFVERHLQQCAFCRKALEELQETSMMIRSLPNVSMTEGFQDQLHELLVRVDQDLYRNGEGKFKQSWLQWLFRSYRTVSVAVILVLCFAAYSFTALNKNMPYIEHAPSLINAGIAEDKGDGARMESTEKALQSEQYANQKALIANNQSQLESGKSKSHLLLFFVLAVVVPFLIVKIISRFLRKY